MKTVFRNMNSRLFALLAALVLALAQGGAQAQPAHAFSQPELDRILAPIALYPDALLSQILMAATYPLEVAEAARWAAERPDLSGDAAVRTAETENWDPSVKSLLAFPQLLARMAENLQWTQALGDAFLDWQPQVMDTVQALRRKAQAAGNLRSDARMSVVESGPSVLVQPADPQIVHLPYYDPLVVYGSWWWPAYPPVYFRPWPGYYALPAYASGFYWGPAAGISAGFFFGAIDWRRREVRVVHVNHIHYRPQTTVHPANANPPPRVNRPAPWRHDPDRRRGLPYRSTEVQQRFGAAVAPPDRAVATQHTDRSIDARAAARPESRPEGRRPDVRHAVEPRATVQAAPAAPAIIQAAPVIQSQPAAQPAPAAQPEPADRRIDRRRELRGAAQPAQPPVVMKPVPLMQSAPVVQPAPALQQRMEVRPAQNAARQEAAPTAVARHEPAARPAREEKAAARSRLIP